MLRRALRQAEQATYTVRRAGAAYRAGNPAQSLQVLFTAAGPRLSGGAGGTWGLTLAGCGRGRLRGVAAGARVAHGAELEYRRGALTEWYRNSARGLEQGFTLAARPVGPAGAPLTLVLRLSGRLRARLANGGTTVELLGPRGSARWRYGGLGASDAAGRRLAARLVVRGDELRLVVGDRGARYPVRIDHWVQQAELSASDGAARDVFGLSVALSGDGSTALVGADGKKSGAGAAYVFASGGTSWSQQAKLSAGDAAAGHAGAGSAAPARWAARPR